MWADEKPVVRSTERRRHSAYFDASLFTCRLSLVFHVFLLALLSHALLARAQSARTALLEATQADTVEQEQEQSKGAPGNIL